jgi:hypothetical protein
MQRRVAKRIEFDDGKWLGHEESRGCRFTNLRKGCGGNVATSIQVAIVYGAIPAV